LPRLDEGVDGARVRGVCLRVVVAARVRRDGRGGAHFNCAPCRVGGKTAHEPVVAGAGFSRPALAPAVE